MNNALQITNQQIPKRLASTKRQLNKQRQIEEIKVEFDLYMNRFSVNKKDQGKFAILKASLLEFSYQECSVITLDSLHLIKSTAQRKFAITDTILELSQIVECDLELEAGDLYSLVGVEHKGTALCMAAGIIGNPFGNKFNQVTGDGELIVEKLLRLGAKTDYLKANQMRAIQHVVDRVNQ